MGCSFIASVQKAAGKVLRPVAQVAAVIPGPWQVPALAAMAVDNAVNGNILGAVAAGVGPIPVDYSPAQAVPVGLAHRLAFLG